MLLPLSCSSSFRWIPPPLPIVEERPPPPTGFSSAPPAPTTFAAGKGRRGEQERALTDSQRDEFEDMLRALTLERATIREVMAFSLDNAEAAGEIVEVLTESLTLLETPIPTKVARLMLVSDILHNSSAPVKNASAYRSGFQNRMPDIMESFNDLLQGITGRITAEALKERVLKVLQVWTDWFLFSEAYINGLRSTFLRASGTSVTPFHQLVNQPEEEGALQGSSSRQGGTGSENGPLSLSGAGGPGGGAGAGMNAEGMQDASGALANLDDVARSELASLSRIEIERRCKFNGLSIRGGVDVMIARLVGLEAAEREKNRSETAAAAVAAAAAAATVAAAISARNAAAAAAEEKDALGKRGKGRAGWAEVTGGGWTEVTREKPGEKAELATQPEVEKQAGGGITPPETNGSVEGFAGSNWNRYGTEMGEEAEDRRIEKNVRRDERDSASNDRESGERERHDGGVGPLPSSLLIPLPEVGFGAKGVSKAGSGNLKPESQRDWHEAGLPVSKWNKDYDDDEDGDEERGGQESPQQGGKNGAGATRAAGEEEKEAGRGQQVPPQGGNLLGLGGYSSEDDSEDGERSGRGGVRKRKQKEAKASGPGKALLDEQKRQTLRQLEVAVMEYREALEGGAAGGKSAFEMEVKVAAHRKKLEAEVEAGTWPPPKAASAAAGRSGSLERWPAPSSTNSQLEQEERRERKRRRSPNGSRSPPRRHSARDRSEREDGRGERERSDHDGDSRRGKERERERERESDKERGRDRDCERERDKDASGGEKRREREKTERRSTRGEGDEEKSSKEREREKSRDKPREKSREKEDKREKEKNGKDRDRERDRDRGDRERDRGDRERERDRDRGDKDRDRERERDRDKRTKWA
eukprot:TRINITY_DN703_c1_g1_i3.p1 TRINITY_DN703_c1_g1~~TRINITY_DN703_c1_g1_i3.p1  ORF type:complete len:874 (-),score=260.41 TRINITY_DN703_c1_g1_i3:91-2712(-)